MLATIHNSVGLAYGELRVFDKAEVHLQKAVDLARQYGHFDIIAHGLQNLGEMAFDQQKWTQTITYFNEGIDFYLSIDYHYELGGCYHGLAKALLKNKETKAAIKAYKQAIQQLQKIKKGDRLRQQILLEMQQINQNES
jgi:tetratricopeptide (TPR) repeat protein